MGTLKKTFLPTFRLFNERMTQKKEEIQWQCRQGETHHSQFISMEMHLCEKIGL